VIAFLILAIALIPFVAPPVLVGNDVHSHLLAGWIITHFHDSALQYSHYFDINWAPVPTALGDLLIGGLATLLPPMLAEKAYYICLGLLLWWGGTKYFKTLGQTALLAVTLFPLLHDSFMFTGFLPYAASVVVYPLLLSVLLQSRSDLRKYLLVTCLLLIAYGFHVVSGAIGCFTAFVFALDFRRKRIELPLLLCLMPTALLILYFLYHKPHGEIIYYPTLLGQIKSFFGHNTFALSTFAGYAFLALVGFFLAAAVFHVSRRAICNTQLLVLALILILTGIAMPYQMGAAAPVGARAFPFAIICLMGAVSWSRRQTYALCIASLAFLIISSALSTRRELNTQKDYDVFLSGMPAIAPGSKILPIVEDPKYGGNQYVHGFDSIEALYTVFRGGANPYVFAMPFDPTGGTLLKARFEDRYAAWFSKHPISYEGVSRYYDYIVCWGDLKSAKDTIAKETDLVVQNGLLSIYKSRLAGHLPEQ
jgi:hypothetical protein